MSVSARRARRTTTTARFNVNLQMSRNHPLSRCVLIVSQEYSRGNNASTRHIVRPALPPLRQFAPSFQPRTDRKLSVSFGSSLFPVRGSPTLIGYVFVRLSCPDRTNAIVLSPAWSAAYLRGMKRQFIFSSDNISDSQATEIYRIVKSRFSAISPPFPVNCYCGKINWMLFEFGGNLIKGQSGLIIFNLLRRGLLFDDQFSWFR